MNEGPDPGYNRPVTYTYRPTGATWPSWVNVLAGIWEIFAPWIWGYSYVPRAVWNDVILGILIFVAALGALGSRIPWPSWWNVVFGIWLIIAPFVLFYAYIERATANDIAVGVVVVIMAVIAALSKPYSEPVV